MIPRSISIVWVSIIVAGCQPEPIAQEKVPLPTTGIATTSVAVAPAQAADTDIEHGSLGSAPPVSDLTTPAGGTVPIAEAPVGEATALGVPAVEGAQAPDEGAAIDDVGPGVDDGLATTELGRSANELAVARGQEAPGFQDQVGFGARRTATQGRPAPFAGGAATSGMVLDDNGAVAASTRGGTTEGAIAAAERNGNPPINGVSANDTGTGFGNAPVGLTGRRRGATNAMTSSIPPTATTGLGTARTSVAQPAPTTPTAGATAAGTATAER